MRTRFRKPLLYPLSYGGRATLCRAGAAARDHPGRRVTGSLRRSPGRRSAAARGRSRFAAAVRCVRCSWGSAARSAPPRRQAQPGLVRIGGNLGSRRLDLSPRGKCTITSEPSASASVTRTGSELPLADGTSDASSMSSGLMPTTTSRSAYCARAGRRASSERGNVSVTSPSSMVAAPSAAVRRDWIRFIAGEPMKPGNEGIRGLVVQHLRDVDLLELPVPHDGHAITHRHRLGLVVRHVERRRPQQRKRSR